MEDCNHCGVLRERMKQDNLLSIYDVVKNSLLQQKTRQVLVKEVVRFRPARNVQRELTEAGNTVAAGESLYLMQLRHHHAGMARA